MPADPYLIFMFEELNSRDAAIRYIFLTAHLISIAQDVSCKSGGIPCVRALRTTQEKCAKARAPSGECSATTRNLLAAVGSGWWLDAAIYSAQNPVAFSYFPRQNVAALRGVKLIGLISHAN